MSKLLSQLERERQLEKIRGKATRAPRKPKAPKAAKALRLERSRVELRPYDDEAPAIYERAPKLPRTVPWGYLEGFAIVSRSLHEDPRVVGRIEIERPRAEGKPVRFAGARHGLSMTPILATMAEAAEIPLGPGGLSDDDRAALEQLEAQIRSYYA